MSDSLWWGRGMKRAVAGTAAAMLFSLAAYPFLPDIVIKHGDFTGPDDWTTKSDWLLFQLLFLPGIAAFIMVFVVGLAAAGSGSLNLKDPEALKYWTAPENWARARLMIADTTGTFVAGLELILAVDLVVAGAGGAWGIPYWITVVAPAILIGLLLWWLVRTTNRAFRRPAQP